MYKLTEEGIKKCEIFIAECNTKRKEILDANKDTADNTLIIAIEDIEAEIHDFIDEDGEYYNCWGVTDNYDSDYPICLKLGVDFVER